ncbi:hypothetical protein BJ138DRAFT_1152804 [Hygrophoropsis aurantiaca]|uniref:Uncharacterized protein n=1 Tax=Hygrophoropsis aurantiaca TaxID=72124 RepID=A0ACB8ACQ4_9AGAM|nr:hypothetical protein BJ138DRAFT_1152804 [Hygrophoropsis aurantiaca]
MLQNLPVELLCKIIKNLPIETILLLRRVSEDIKQVTYDRSIWDYAYRTSSLLRPPGPFAWQTAHVIESNLIRSARLSLNWAPNPDAKPLLCRVINFPEGPYGFVTLGGRWLLITSHSDCTRILCYDLDRTEKVTTEDHCSILYECSKEEGGISQLSGEQTFLSERGNNDSYPVGFIAIVVYNAALSTRKKALYRVTVAGGRSLSLQMVLQTDTATPDPRPIVVIGARLVAFHENGTSPQSTVLVDIETHQHYEFPQHASRSAKQLIPQGDYEFTTFTIIVSSTHVILMRRYNGQFGLSNREYKGTFIQAYTIPIVQASGTASQASLSTPVALQLSHQSVTTSYLNDRSSCILLRDSQLDRHTNAIHMSFTIFAPHREFISTFRLTLDEALQGVGHISSRSHQDKIHLGSLWGYFAVMPSLNGWTRGVRCFRRGRTLRLTGFVIDDDDGANTQSAVVQDMQWLRELRFEEYKLLFDGSCGRIILVFKDDGILKILDFV